MVKLISINVIASFIFLILVLVLFRPHVKIGKIICKSQSKFDDKISYSFKIVNKSYFSAYDVKVELLSVQKYQSEPPKIVNQRQVRLEMINDYVSHVSPFMHNFLNYQTETNYAIRFRTFEVLEKIVSDTDRGLILQVTLRHGLSGLSNVFTQEYFTKYVIKSGNFKSGAKIEVFDE